MRLYALLHRAIARLDTRCAVRVCVHAQATRMRFYRALHGRIARSDARYVGSTYVYVHKCVEEECGIASRSDRTRCTQYLTYQDGSNSEPVNVLEMRDHKHGDKVYRNIRTTARYSYMWGQFSQKSAEIKKKNTQADRSFSRARNIFNGINSI